MVQVADCQNIIIIKKRKKKSSQLNTEGLKNNEF